MCVKARPNIQHCKRMREAKANVCDGVFDIYIYINMYNVYKHANRSKKSQPKHRSWRKYVQNTRPTPSATVLLTKTIFIRFCCCYCSHRAFYICCHILRFLFISFFFFSLNFLPRPLAVELSGCNVSAYTFCLCNVVHIYASSMLKGISLCRYFVPNEFIKSVFIEQSSSNICVQDIIVRK